MDDVDEVLGASCFVQRVLGAVVVFVLRSLRPLCVMKELTCMYLTVTRRGRGGAGGRQAEEGRGVDGGGDVN